MINEHGTLAIEHPAIHTTSDITIFWYEREGDIEGDVWGVVFSYVVLEGVVDIPAQALFEEVDIGDWLRIIIIN